MFEDGKRYVVLDRDGTIIVEKHYLSTPEEVELLPGAVSGLYQLYENGFGIVIMTNQSGIQRGYFTLEQVQEIHKYLEKILKKEGIRVDGIYICPHLPEEGCLCRKPNTGLMVQAVSKLFFNPKEAFVLGDKPYDIEFGKRAGSTAILLRTGYGKETEKEKTVVPDYVCDDLEEAAGIIISLRKERAHSSKRRMSG